MPDQSRTSIRRPAPGSGRAPRRSATGALDEERVDELLAGLPANADFATIGDRLATADLGLRVDLLNRVQELASNAGASALVGSSGGDRAPTGLPATPAVSLPSQPTTMSVQRQTEGTTSDIGQSATLDQQAISGVGGEEASMLTSLPGIGDPVGLIFARVVASNVAGSSAIAVPARYVTLLRAYAAFDATDGAILTAALARSPTFHSGGWILDIQRGAVAMTLDTDVFVRGDALHLGTYIHEMVHVKQYGDLGPSNFLAAYFGLAALEISRRLLMHLPIDPMTASPLETQAYALEDRFMAWWRAHPEADPASPPSGGTGSP